MTEERNRELTETRSEIQSDPTGQGSGSKAIRIRLPGSDLLPPEDSPDPAPRPGSPPIRRDDGPALSTLFPNRAPVGSEALDVIIIGGFFEADVQVFARRATDTSAPAQVPVQRLSDTRLQISIDRALGHFNRGDLEAYLTIYAEDAVMHDYGVEPGLENIWQFYRDFSPLSRTGTSPSKI